MACETGCGTGGCGTGCGVGSPSAPELDIPLATVRSGSRGKLTLDLATTALCDLDCTYCFEGEKVNKQKLEALDTLILRIREILTSDWFKQNYDGMSLSFWGGEPTLNPNYIIKIINEFQDTPEVIFHMYTNGFNIKNMKKVIENVNTSRFEIQVSYDGRPINDRFRLTKNGKTTSDTVLETFDYLANQGITVFFKSTIPSTAVGLVHKVWLDFEQLYEKYKTFPNVRVTYSPTIDYAMSPSEEAKQRKIETFRSQMLLIAKQEIEFYKKYKKHLCTWFGGPDQKFNCAAGLNMMAVDVDGATYACHGVMYEEGKDTMKSSSIFDENFVNSIAKYNDSFEDVVYSMNDVCKNCVATTCLICPASTYSVSKKEGFFDRWGDRHVNGLCGFYQAFGEIDRSVQHYLLTLKET